MLWPLSGLQGIALNNLFKNLAIWLVIGVVLMTVFNQFNTRQAAQNSVEYSQFMAVPSGQPPRMDGKLRSTRPVSRISGWWVI